MTARLAFQSRRGLAATIGAIAVVLLTLAGAAVWWLHRWRVLTFGEQFVPMAPSTALMGLALGVAALLHAQARASRVARAVALVLTCGTLLGAGLLGLGFVFGFSLPAESWLAPDSETVRGIPVGRMSPLTAGCLVGLALALLCAQGTAGRWRSLRSLGGALALAVLAVSAIVVAGYLVGTPILYGGGTIPMALLTAVALLLLSAVALLTLGTAAWPLRMFLRVAFEEEPGSGYQVEWPLLLIFVVLAAAIGAVGFEHLRQEQREARLAAYGQLEAILRLKVEQVVQWRKERLTDAKLMRAIPDAARRGLDDLAAPESARTRGMFAGILQPLLASGFYDRALLLDADLNVRLVYPPGPIPALPEATRRVAEEAFRTCEVALGDLHRTSETDPIHLDLFVPLVQGSEGTRADVPEAGVPPSATDRSAGLLVLQLDAHHLLFPLIQTWPAPSQTAETLLVRREGDDVVFLNDLRHLAGTALKLRRPLNDAKLPAAAGWRGEHTVMEGVDYRGVPVVAATQRVPETGWLMVAKVDQAELYAPLRREALRVASMVFVLLASAVLGVTALWRRRHEQWLSAQLTTERERRTFAERYEHLMQQAGDAILLADEQGRILEANDSARALYGYSLAEMRQLRLLEVRAPECRDDPEPQGEALTDTGCAVFETRHRRKDGTTFPVEIRSRVVVIGGERYWFGIIRDISERKAQEAEIRRLNRLYATLSQINQAVVRAETREGLLERVCQIAVDYGGFALAWVGRHDSQTGLLTPVAWAGGPPEFIRCMQHSASDEPAHACLCGEALRTGQAAVINELSGDPRVAGWWAKLETAGLRAGAVLLIRLRGEIWGVFGVYAAESGVFQQKELALLEEAVSDISFAMEHLEIAQTMRRQATLLREMSRLARVGGAEFDPSTGKATWTDEFARICDLDPAAEATFELGISVFRGESRRKIETALWEAVEQGKPYDLELEIITAKGNRKWVRTIGLVERRGNRVVNVHGAMQDITERKQAEQAFQQGAQEFRAMFELASIGMAQADVHTGQWLRVNDKFCAITGYSAIELLQMRIPEITHPEDRELDWALFQRVVRGESPDYRLEKRYLRKDGKVIWVNVNMTVIRDAAGTPVRAIATIEDITEKKRLEEDRAAMEAQLRQQQKLESIGTLASGVAHEINNPITGVLNYAQLIHDRLPADSPLAEFAGEIMRETQRVADIVRNLLTFARYDKQRHSPARIADIIEATLSLIRTVIRRDGIRLTVDVPEALPQLRCRSQQIQQVLMNLMTNARDALNERYPGPDPDKVLSIAVRCLDKGGRRWIRVTVEDHGTGITPEVRERMFDPFFTTKPHDRGTGLGLSISHGIVNDHHGEITVESEPGKHTRIHVDLPVDNGGEV